jgi:hypothetical protein
MAHTEIPSGVKTSTMSMKDIREKEKAQKAARRQKMEAQKTFSEFKSDLHLVDVFAVLQDAHKVCRQTNIVEGILPFLDLSSVLKLASTCKTLRTDVKKSNIRNHPIYVQMYSQMRINKMEAIHALHQKEVEEMKRVKYETLEKIRKQLVHIARFKPANYESVKNTLFLEWKTKYKTNLQVTWNGVYEYSDRGDGYVPYFA